MCGSVGQSLSGGGGYTEVCVDVLKCVWIY